MDYLYVASRKVGLNYFFIVEFIHCGYSIDLFTVVCLLT